jgi:hypothetical protein
MSKLFRAINDAGAMRSFASGRDLRPFYFPSISIPKCRLVELWRA